MAMQHGLGEVKSISIDPYGVRRLELACASNLIPSAGQVSLALLPATEQTIRFRLYPTEILKTGFVSDWTPEPHWLPGASLDLHGPVGVGFRPPSQAAKWLLMSFASLPSRLIPLIQRGLEDGVSISLWSDIGVVGMPKDLEIINSPEDACDWADYLAIDFGSHPVESLSERLAGLIEHAKSLPSDILLDTDLPCGFGACDVCSVRTRKGWVRNCLAGPVHNLREVLLSQ